MYGVPATPAPVVSYVMHGGAAEAAGLQSGDRIVSFNGTDNPKWDIIRGDGLLSPGQPLPLVVDRGGQRLSLTIKPTPRTEDGETAGTLDFIPDYGGLPIVGREVTPNSPASEAGLQIGARILAINGNKLKRDQKATPDINKNK